MTKPFWMPRWLWNFLFEEGKPKLAEPVAETVTKAYVDKQANGFTPPEPMPPAPRPVSTPPYSSVRVANNPAPSPHLAPTPTSVASAKAAEERREREFRQQRDEDELRRRRAADDEDEARRRLNDVQALNLLTIAATSSHATPPPPATVYMMPDAGLPVVTCDTEQPAQAPAPQACVAEPAPAPYEPPAPAPYEPPAPAPSVDTSWSSSTSDTSWTSND